MTYGNRKVKEFLGKHNDVLIKRRIPPYAPYPNLGELVWNALKYQKLLNFSPESYEKLCERAEIAMNMMKSDPESMREIIRGIKLPLASTVGN